MTARLIILFILSSIVLSSCYSLEKRLYRKGVYIEKQESSSVRKPNSTSSLPEISSEQKTSNPVLSQEDCMHEKKQISAAEATENASIVSSQAIPVKSNPKIIPSSCQVQETMHREALPSSQIIPEKSSLRKKGHREKLNWKKILLGFLLLIVAAAGIAWTVLIYSVQFADAIWLCWFLALFLIIFGLIFILEDFQKKKEKDDEAKLPLGKRMLGIALVILSMVPLVLVSYYLLPVSPVMEALLALWGCTLYTFGFVVYSVDFHKYKLKLQRVSLGLLLLVVGIATYLGAYLYIPSRAGYETVTVLSIPLILGGMDLLWPEGTLGKHKNNKSPGVIPRN
jgi:putative Mn2+ efflux pump MntP